MFVYKTNFTIQNCDFTSKQLTAFQQRQDLFYSTVNGVLLAGTIIITITDKTVGTARYETDPTCFSCTGT